MFMFQSPIFFNLAFLVSCFSNFNLTWSVTLTRVILFLKYDLSQVICNPFRLNVITDGEICHCWWIISSLLMEKSCFGWWKNMFLADEESVFGWWLVEKTLVAKGVILFCLTEKPHFVCCKNLILSYGEISFYLIDKSLIDDGKSVMNVLQITFN